MIHDADSKNPGSRSELVLNPEIIVTGAKIAARVIVGEGDSGDGFWGNVTSDLGLARGMVSPMR